MGFFLGFLVLFHALCHPVQFPARFSDLLLRLLALLAVHLSQCRGEPPAGTFDDGCRRLQIAL
ncbi:MAG: hypothetical protein JNL98_25805 [Bryobacterales bacterium]|nr:hypothetical protein [Bryobacterales bacterium]